MTNQSNDSIGEPGGCFLEQPKLQLEELDGTSESGCANVAKEEASAPSSEELIVKSDQNIEEAQLSEESSAMIPDNECAVVVVADVEPTPITDEMQSQVPGETSEQQQEYDIVSSNDVVMETTGGKTGADVAVPVSNEPSDAVDDSKMETDPSGPEETPNADQPETAEDEIIIPMESDAVSAEHVEPNSASDDGNSPPDTSNGDEKAEPYIMETESEENTAEQPMQESVESDVFPTVVVEVESSNASNDDQDKTSNDELPEEERPSETGADADNNASTDHEAVSDKNEEDTTDCPPDALASSAGPPSSAVDQDSANKCDVGLEDDIPAVESKKEAEAKIGDQSTEDEVATNSSNEMEEPIMHQESDENAASTVQPETAVVAKELAQTLEAEVANQTVEEDSEATVAENSVKKDTTVETSLNTPKPAEGVTSDSIVDDKVDTSADATQHAEEIDPNTEPTVVDSNTIPENAEANENQASNVNAPIPEGTVDVSSESQVTDGLKKDETTPLSVGTNAKEEETKDIAADHGPKQNSDTPSVGEADQSSESVAEANVETKEAASGMIDQETQPRVSPSETDEGAKNTPTSETVDADANAPKGSQLGVTQAASGSVDQSADPEPSAQGSTEEATPQLASDESGGENKDAEDNAHVEIETKEEPNEATTTDSEPVPKEHTPDDFTKNEDSVDNPPVETEPKEAITDGEPVPVEQTTQTESADKKLDAMESAPIDTKPKEAITGCEPVPVEKKSPLVSPESGDKQEGAADNSPVEKAPSKKSTAESEPVLVEEQTTQLVSAESADKKLDAVESAPVDTEPKEAVTVSEPVPVEKKPPLVSPEPGDKQEDVTDNAPVEQAPPKEAESELVPAEHAENSDTPEKLPATPVSQETEKSTPTATTAGTIEDTKAAANDGPIPDSVTLRPSKSGTVSESAAEMISTGNDEEGQTQTDDDFSYEEEIVLEEYEEVEEYEVEYVDDDFLEEEIVEEEEEEDSAEEHTASSFTEVTYDSQDHVLEDVITTTKQPLSKSAMQKKLEREEARKRAEAEEARLNMEFRLARQNSFAKKDDELKRRLAEEEERHIREEEEREQQRIAAEERDAQIRAQEAATRIAQQQTEELRRLLEEEENRRKLAEAEARRLAAENAAREKAEADRKRREADEAERQARDEKKRQMEEEVRMLQEKLAEAKRAADAARQKQLEEKKRLQQSKSEPTKRKVKKVKKKSKGLGDSVQSMEEVAATTPLSPAWSPSPAANYESPAKPTTPNKLFKSPKRVSPAVAVNSPAAPLIPKSPARVAAAASPVHRPQTPEPPRPRTPVRMTLSPAPPAASPAVKSPRPSPTVASPVPSPAPAPAAVATATGGGGPYYSVEELRKQSVPGLDYKNREIYLHPDDFVAVFGVDKAEFDTYPKWKKTNMKRKKKLF